MIDFTGQIFGRLTIIGEGQAVGKHRKLLCQCSCGVTKEMYLTVIKAGALSCGCLRLEKITTHGQSRIDNPLYSVWTNMRSRCNDINATYYAEYGGRGIKISDEWNSFENFQTWANTAGYSKDLTLDRQDNDLNYSPDNCRWVNRITQQRNRRSQKNSTSKYVGVSYRTKDSSWAASIKVNGKSINLGTYPTERMAAQKRDQYIIDNKLENFTMNKAMLELADEEIVDGVP